MRSLLLPLLSLSLIGFAIAGPHLSPYILHEKRRHVPPGWSHSHRVSQLGVLPLRLGLTQSNIDSIEDYLLDVSAPDSPNYGKHWSPAKVAETFAPSRDTIDTVRNWLIDNGIARERLRLTPSRGWIEVNVTIEEAERLLLAEYNVYKHESGAEHVGASIFLVHLA
jgi:tripeptidyl-peptidase I